MSVKVRVSLCVLVAALTGCAGSANHEVVSAYNATDASMNCSQITAEQVRVQAIINAVNQDKDDVTGADMLDGILWFPFNLIAKNNNYKSALKAADQRLARLDELRKGGNCSDEQLAEAEQRMESKLKELKNLRDKDLITQEEYNASRKAVLSQGYLVNM